MADQAALSVLLGTAVSVAAVHTVIGVDHSLPFVVLGKARGWSLRRVLLVTAVCGLGHVASSVLLGAAGIGLGVALERLELIETTRGGLAAWLLIGFGALYALRAVVRRARGHVHEHAHAHRDGVVHRHPHDHHEPAHQHAHLPQQAKTVGASATVWALFVIFVLGPCEPLIPLLMAPAAIHSIGWALLVASVFAAVTIAAMLVVVAIGYVGLSRLRATALAAHADVLAGLAIASSGLAIQIFGL